MAAEILDLQHLSSYCSLPQDTFTVLLSTPTVDLVRALLHAVTQKAREHEGARSESLRLSVELENAVRTGETKARILKSSNEKHLKEKEEVRQKLQAAGMLQLSNDRVHRLTPLRTVDRNLEGRFRDSKYLELVICGGNT